MGWKYLAYAATALCASVGIIVYLKKRQSSSDFITTKVLSPESYKEVATAMRALYSKNYWKELALSRSKRRNLLARSAEYEKEVTDFQNLVKELVQRAQKQILGEYRIKSEYFENSVNFYDSDYEMKQYGNDLVNPYSNESQKKKLGKEETERILTYYSSRMKDFEIECPDLDEYMIINMEIEDEIFRNFKVEIEEVNAAWEMHKKDLEDIVEPLKNQTHFILASTNDSY
jgi:hypothetical protein